jgi:ATP-binding cassette subfamily B protein
MKKLLNLTKYLKPYRKEVVFSIVLLASVVFLDLMIPRLVQQIIDKGIANNDMRVVLNTSLLMLGVSILNTVFAIANNTLSVRIGEAFARDLRHDLFLKIQQFSYGNLDRLRTGNLIVRLTSDIMVLQRVIRMSLRIGTRGPLLIVGSFVLLISTDAALTLRIFPLFVFIGILIWVFITKLSPIFLKVQKKRDRLNTVLQENIAGVRVVKAFVRQDHEKKRFEGANEDFKQIHVKILRITSTIMPTLFLLVNVGILIVIYFGGGQAIAGDLSVGQIIAFANYLATAMVPLLIMAMLASVVASGIASAKRVGEVLEEDPEVVDKAGASRLPEKIEGRVVFENVGFFYNGSCDEKILDRVNLIAEPGQTVAILGATGSGKTTLVNLIPRFYDVAEGRVTIDGMDVRDLEQDSLLSHVAITPQETVLFSGSVQENISYGKLDATDQEIISAAKAAQAHEFISEMPEGYQTEIAARGVNLSGGQKQRIAIARAILMHPEILILDDSTSSVDVETESKIQDALDQLIEGTTTFIVAQRISTVLNADKIVVIDKGRIAAEGKHAELLKTSKIYKEIYDSQLGDGNKH